MFDKFLQPHAEKIAAGEPYKVYGRAASTMSDSGFKRKVGSYANSAGAKGEHILFEKLRNPKNGWVPADTPLFCSLKVPGKNSDIDFVIVRGSKVLLIDAKMYRQDGGFYWNYGDRSTMMRNLSTYTTKSGDPMKLSKSMVMAKDIISRNLPGFTVESLVIMTTDDSNPKAKKPMTWFLKFPGDITVCNDSSAPRYIRRFLGGQVRTTDTYNAEKFLRGFVQ